jgi:hypothetical protein
VTVSRETAQGVAALIVGVAVLSLGGLGVVWAGSAVVAAFLAWPQLVLVAVVAVLAGRRATTPPVRVGSVPQGRQGR